jgi:hypothetical protein
MRYVIDQHKTIPCNKIISPPPPPLSFKKTKTNKKQTKQTNKKPQKLINQFYSVTNF